MGAAYAMAGRYEEARAPLQRFLSRYPNRLDIHLMLAAVCSELAKPPRRGRRRQKFYG